MSAELREYPQHQEHPQHREHPQHQEHPQHPSQQSQDLPLYSTDIPSPVKESEPFVEMQEEEELYQSALDEAAQEVEDVSGIDVSDLLDSKSVEVTKAPSKAKASIPVVTKLSANYESMTLAELKALAKQRQITGSSSMKRSQILEALRGSEKVDGGVLSALSEQSEEITLD